MITTATEKDYTFEGIANVSIDQMFQALTSRDLIQEWWENPVMGSPKEGGTLYFLFEDSDEYTIMHVDRADVDKGVLWTVRNDTTSEGDWIGTILGFELEEMPHTRTMVRFTHIGMHPGKGSYEDCSESWDHYLKNLIRVSEGSLHLL